MIKVKLLEHTPHPERVVAMAARLCYSAAGAEELAEKMTDEQVEKLVDKIKKFYEKHFKAHCPDCGGVMDGDQLDMTINKIIYTCRECGKEWF